MPNIYPKACSYDCESRNSFKLTSPLATVLTKYVQLVLSCLFLMVLPEMGIQAAAYSDPFASPVTKVRHTNDYSWSQEPDTDLTLPGEQTINLPYCPPGVRADEPEYWIYVGTTGTAEAARVKDGTCRGDGKPGTLKLTTAYPHTAGYSIGTASGGIQEAIVDARIVPSKPTGFAQSGKVVVSPGEVKAHARISIRSSNITVDFTSSILECYMEDTCIFIGDPANSGKYQGITLISPRGRPMVRGGHSSFIEVNALGTRLYHVSTRLAAPGSYFSSYVQVDGDEAFLLDGLDTTLGAGGSNYGVRCDATRCDPVIYAPGPFSANGDAVGWLTHLNISMQCTGNGIDWQSGNTLRVSDSVIQGYLQYGVRGGTRRGGYGGIELDNVYEEVGNCGQNLKNPLGNVGEAGVIAQGSTVKVIGGEAPTGVVPVFVNTNAGSTDYRYYVVARHATYGASVPLYAGKSSTNGCTNNCGTVTVVAPDIAGAATYDLLRVTASSPEKAPYGTGAYAVMTGVTKASACAAGACTFTDPEGMLALYTVPQTQYFPMINFWPGNLVIGSSGDSPNSQAGPGHAILDKMTGSIVSVLGGVVPSVSAFDCSSMSSYSTLWATCINAGIAGQSFLATILGQADASNNGPAANHKGRLNFGKLVPALPNHLITLADSAFDKTTATAGGRPPNDASDVFIGLDGTAAQGISQAQLAFGAPKAVSNYIGNVGDGTNWKERLTASAKTFRVPVTTPQLILTPPTGTPPIDTTSTTPVPNLRVSRHPAVQGCGTAEKCSATTITNAQIVFGKITLTAGVATLTGIIPSFRGPAGFGCVANDLDNPANGVNAVPQSASSVRFTGTGAHTISYQCVGD